MYPTTRTLSMIAVVTLGVWLGVLSTHTSAGICPGGVPCVNSNDLIDGRVRADDLAARAVETGKIRDEAVTIAKLAPRVRRLLSLWQFNDPDIFFDGGNVGIGTATPNTLLHIDGTGIDNTGVTAVVRIISGNGAQNLLLDGNEIDATADGLFLNNNTAENIILANGGGNVGIGTATPGFLLHVNGSAGKPGGGSWAVASDRRLKKNIQSLDGVLDHLLQLRGVTFEYQDPAAIHELSGMQTGMIAQEVEQVFPQWVEKATDGYKRLTFRGFEALTVEALRELREEKDAQISALAARLEVLEQTLQRQSAPVQSSFFGLSTGWPFFGGLFLVGFVLGQRWRKPGASTWHCDWE